jgi:monoamine oxidase
LPPRLLEATVAFSPGQDPATAKLWRETPTWMAPTAKFVALYDQPFWRDAGLSGTAQSLVGPLAEMHDASTASGRPALFGFLGVGADQRAVHGQEALTRACLAQLARIFGPMALEPRGTLVKDWTADSLTATDRDRGAGDHVVPRDVPWLAPPWMDRLALAGSETSPSEPGYLVGAVVAAERAVADTLRGL